MESSLACTRTQTRTVVENALPWNKHTVEAMRWSKKLCNYSAWSEYSTEWRPWGVCGGSVVGRDANTKRTGRYSQRLPEQIPVVATVRDQC